MKMNWNIVFLAVLVLPAQQVLSQEWLVPSDQSAITNPSDYTLENVKKGKEIYMRNCKSCHGDPGKNNPLALKEHMLSTAQTNTLSTKFNCILGISWCISISSNA